MCDELPTVDKTGSPHPHLTASLQLQTSSVSVLQSLQQKHCFSSKDTALTIHNKTSQGLAHNNVSSEDINNVQYPSEDMNISLLQRLGVIKSDSSLKPIFTSSTVVAVTTDLFYMAVGWDFQCVLVDKPKSYKTIWQHLYI